MTDLNLKQATTVDQINWFLKYLFFFYEFKGNLGNVAQM